MSHRCPWRHQQFRLHGAKLLFNGGVVCLGEQGFIPLQGFLPVSPPMRHFGEPAPRLDLRGIRLQDLRIEAMGRIKLFLPGQDLRERHADLLILRMARQHVSIQRGRLGVGALPREHSRQGATNFIVAGMLLQHFAVDRFRFAILFPYFERGGALHGEREASRLRVLRGSGRIRRGGTRRLRIGQQFRLDSVQLCFDFGVVCLGEQSFIPLQGFLPVSPPMRHFGEPAPRLDLRGIRLQDLRIEAMGRIKLFLPGQDLRERHADLLILRMARQHVSIQRGRLGVGALPRQNPRQSAA